MPLLTRGLLHLSAPNRRTPLERDIRIAQTETSARKQFKRMAEENFIGGWEKVGR